MRRATYLVVVAVLAGLAPWALGQIGDSQQTLQQKLAAQFALTKTTADKSDIIKAGSVLVLQKDGLLMYSLATPIPPLNTYKKGKISQGFGSGFMRDLGNVMVTSAYNASSIPQRKFMAGEKFWVTSCVIQTEGIVFQFYSDPFNGIRYYGQLKFPFPKGQMPPADEALKTIAEVLTVEATNNATEPPPAPTNPAPGQTTSALQEITPPAPPVDAPPPAPKEIEVGQTKEQVIATFGQPQKVVKLATKQLDYYPDMKVTYSNGKVSTVDELSPQAAPVKDKQ